MGKITIVEVETYNRLDNIYIEVHCEQDGETWIDNFAGEEWLQLDDKGQEKFVARVIKNREDSNKQGLNNLDELKLKYKNKEIGVE